MKLKVLNGKMPTAIADTGAYPNCDKRESSICGDFKTNWNSFVETGRKTNTIFQYGRGSLAVADEMKYLPFDVQE